MSDLPELKLSFVNGNGQIALGHTKDVQFDPDSKAAIQSGLDDCKKLPNHIQNPGQRALYVEYQNKLRKWQQAIKKPGIEREEELNELGQLIRDCIKAELKPFNEFLNHVIEQITRWDSTVKVGLSAHTSTLRRKAIEAQNKAETAKSKTEQKRQEVIARKYFKEADKVEKADKEKRAEGAVHKERWGAEGIVDALELVRKADRRFYRIVLEQNEINSYCKDIERNGGTVHPLRTIPGLKLSKKAYTSFF
jgi:hypothetical protein